jgi:hypothetical protein
MLSKVFSTNDIYSLYTDKQLQGNTYHCGKIILVRVQNFTAKFVVMFTSELMLLSEQKPCVAHNETTASVVVFVFTLHYYS